MPAIQFKGIDRVIQAYVDRGIPSFSIWCGSQFIISFVNDDIEEGRAKLDSFLNQLLEGSTNAVYTLKVYEEVPGGKIKDKTPSDGSFNFQLNGPSMLAHDAVQQRISGFSEFSSRLAAIEKALTPVKEPTIYEHILDFCETDVGKIIAPQLIGGVLGMLGIGKTIAPALGSLGQIDPTSKQAERLHGAIERLKRCDTKLTEHLEKLAAIAEQNPQGFQGLLLMLDKM